jgi:hypothetical protein
MYLLVTVTVAISAERTILALQSYRLAGRGERETAALWVKHEPLGTSASETASLSLVYYTGFVIPVLRAVLHVVWADQRRWHAL